MGENGVGPAGRAGLRWGGRVQSSNRIEGRSRWWALGAVMLVMFSASLSGTIVSTAVPTIVADLHGFDLYAWIFTGYMLCSTVVVPITGNLSDIYGRRPFFLIGIVLFMAGSALGGVARSMEVLIAARCVAGAGGGAMMAMATSTIGDIFSPRERGRWMGLVMTSFGLASVIGPTVGGAVTDHWGWRWVYFVNLPMAAIALLVVGVVMPRFRADRRPSIDIPGVVLLVLGVVPILLAITWGGTTYAWSSWQVIASFAGGAAMLVAFVIVELRARNPLLSPVLFKNRVFTLSILISLCVNFGMFGTIQFLPLFVQGVLGKSAQDSGLVMAPMMVPFVLASVVGGQLMARTGHYKALGVAGTAVATAGMLLLTRLGPGSDYLEVIRDQVLLGAGVGLAMPVFSTAVLNAFPQQLMGTVNSARQFFTTLGGVIGIPLLTSVMVQTFSSELPSRLPPRIAPLLSAGTLNPQTLITAQAQAAIRQRLDGLGPGGDQLFVTLVAAIRESLGAGTTHAFLVAAGGLGLALLMAVFVPEQPLRSWGERPSSMSPADPRRLLLAATGYLVLRRRGARVPDPVVRALASAVDDYQRQTNAPVVRTDPKERS